MQAVALSNFENDDVLPRLLSLAQSTSNTNLTAGSRKLLGFWMMLGPSLSCNNSRQRQTIASPSTQLSPPLINFAHSFAERPSLY